MSEEFHCPHCHSPLKTVGKAVVKCEICDVTMPRIAFIYHRDVDPYKGLECHDCGCKEGEIHEYGCDVEVCPFCGGQLCSCNCEYEKLGYHLDENKTFSGLPQDVYEKGVSDEEEKKYVNILEEKGRIPYLAIPPLCRSCGKTYPMPIMWDDWKKNPAMRDILNEKPVDYAKMALYHSLCISCFLKLRDHGEQDLPFPELCEYCGSKQPEYRINSDKIEMRAQGMYLCEKCHGYIKNLLRIGTDMPRKV